MAAAKSTRPGQSKLLAARPVVGCHKCGKGKKHFETESKRRAHVRYCGMPTKAAAKRMPKKKEKITCPHCPDTFKRMQDRGNHISRHHPDKFVPMKSPDARNKQKPKVGVRSRRKKIRKMGNGDPERTLPGKAFDTKDVVRGGLHGLAMLYLRGRIPKRARAICLPGMRPDHERKLFSEFNDVVMVENNGKVTKKVKDAMIIRGDFIDVLINEGLIRPFSMVDFDLCGRPTYREGSIFRQMYDVGLVTKRCCLRITYCTRSSKGSVKEDLEQLDNDIREHFNVMSYEIMPYKNPRGTTMELRQWVLEGRD